MSEPKNTSEPVAIAEVIEKPKMVNMSEEERLKIDRAIQLGERDTLPDGTLISEWKEENERLEIKQAQERAKLIDDENNNTRREDSMKEERRFHFSAGVAAEVPTKEDIKEAKQTGGLTDNENVPKNFPGRQILVDSGNIANSNLMQFTYDDFISVGYDDETAQRAVKALIKMNEK